MGLDQRDSVSHPAGNWGTIGVSDPANVPDGRAGASMGYDLNGNLFLFGGSGYNFTPCNDLWRYKIDPNCSSCGVNVSAGFSSPTEICPGTCVNFTNLSSNATSFIWSFSGANPAFSTDANPTSICYPASGSYDVQLIAISANGNDTLLLSNYITVYPQPGPQSIIQIGDTLFANTGSTSYQWYYNNNLIPGATNFYLPLDSSGNYNVVCTDSNGCEVEAAIFDILAGISQTITIDGDVNLFPNPAGDILFIQMSGTVRNKVVMISIFNALGELVSTKIPADEKNTEIVIDTSELPAGIYFIELSGPDKFLRKKFVKE